MQLNIAHESLKRAALMQVAAYSVNYTTCKLKYTNVIKSNNFITHIYTFSFIYRHILMGLLIGPCNGICSIHSNDFYSVSSLA